MPFYARRVYRARLLERATVQMEIRLAHWSSLSLCILYYTLLEQHTAASSHTHRAQKTVSFHHYVIFYSRIWEQEKSVKWFRVSVYMRTKARANEASQIRFLNKRIHEKRDDVNGRNVNAQFNLRVLIIFFFIVELLSRTHYFLPYFSLSFSCSVCCSVCYVWFTLNVSGVYGLTHFAENTFLFHIMI